MSEPQEQKLCGRVYFLLTPVGALVLSSVISRNWLDIKVSCALIGQRTLKHGGWSLEKKKHN